MDKEKKPLTETVKEAIKAVEETAEATEETTQGESEELDEAKVWAYLSKKIGAIAAAGIMGYIRVAGLTYTELGLKQFYKELGGLRAQLRSCKTVKDASDIILVQYEMPADKTPVAKARRAAVARAVYDMYTA